MLDQMVYRFPSNMGYSVILWKGNNQQRPPNFSARIKVRTTCHYLVRQFKYKLWCYNIIYALDMYFLLSLEMWKIPVSLLRKSVLQSANTAGAARYEIPCLTAAPQWSCHMLWHQGAFSEWLLWASAVFSHVSTLHHGIIEIKKVIKM